MKINKLSKEEAVNLWPFITQVDFTGRNLSFQKGLIMETKYTPILFSEFNVMD